MKNILTKQKILEENVIKIQPEEKDEFIFKNGSRYKGNLKRPMGKRRKAGIWYSSMD